MTPAGGGGVGAGSAGPAVVEEIQLLSSSFVPLRQCNEARSQERIWHRGTERKTHLPTAAGGTHRQKGTCMLRAEVELHEVSAETTNMPIKGACSTSDQPPPKQRRMVQAQAAPCSLLLEGEREGSSYHNLGDQFKGHSNNMEHHERDPGQPVISSGEW